MPFRMPPQSYYPRARLRFILRMEDFGATDTPDVPQRIPTIRQGSKDQGAPGSLQVVQQGTQLLLVLPGSQPSASGGGPLDQTTSEDGRTQVVDGVVPQSATLELNGIRMADKLTATISLRDLPFDPRALRAVGVKYFLGCVTASDADRGSRGLLRQNATSSGLALPYDTIPDTWVDASGQARSNQRFEGFVDDYHLVLEGDQATVQIACVDNTRLLLETDHPGRMSLSTTMPIHRAIANYLASFPKFAGFAVEYRPAVDESLIPVLGNAIAKTAAQPGKGPPQGAAQKVKVWDYLTDAVGMVGHIIFVEGSTIVIQRPRTLYDEGFVRQNDPWSGRVVTGNGQPPLVLPIRMYGYGANVMKLDLGRTYARTAPTNIEVRSYSTRRKKTLWVRFPDRDQGRVKSLLPGQSADLKFDVVRVDGVEDQATLRLIAQAHYEARNRNEFPVSIETKCLASFGGDNLDPDAFDLREGDAMQVQIVRASGPDSPGTVQNMALATATELVQAGFTQALATAYVQARDSILLPNTFRVRQAAFDFTDRGVSLKIDVINYVVAAISKPLPQGEEIAPVQLTETPVTVNVDDAVG